MALVITREQWGRALLNEIGAPVTTRNLRALVAWESAEGTAAQFNPLATTKRMSGSSNFNSTGVQNYVSERDGLEATSQTLHEEGHGYESIVHRLRHNHWAYWTLRAVARSDWGTGSLALRILPYVKANLDRYGSEPIGQ